MSSWLPYQVGYKTKFNRLFAGETIGTTLRNPEDEVIGYLGIIRDVTAREKNSAERPGARTAASTDC